MLMAAVDITAAGTGETIQVGPIRIRVLEDGSRTDNRIGAVEITAPPGVPRSATAPAQDA
jgi:hypothetical protein